MLGRRELLVRGVLAGGAGAVLAAPAAAAERPELAKFTAEIAAAQKRLDAFLLAFNARDVKAYEATFNFPHVRFASSRVTIINPGDTTLAMFERGMLKEWDHSRWLRREVIHAGAEKVHIDTRFARYRKDGSLLGAFDSIYIVTRVDGRWGIQARSSFAG